MDLDAKIAALKKEHGLTEPETGGTRPRAEKKETAPRKDALKPKPKKTNGKAISREEKDDKNNLNFVHAFIRNGCNATGAYQEVFPDCKPASAGVLGWRWLRKVKVQQIMFPLLEALMEKNEVNSEWVLSKWMDYASASPLDYFDIMPDGSLGRLRLDRITDAQRTNLKDIKVKRTAIEKFDDDGELTFTTIHEEIQIKVVDQARAVDQFAKFLQMLVEKLDPEDMDRIGDLIEAGVKRIRANKDLDAWKTVAADGQFSDVG